MVDILARLAEQPYGPRAPVPLVLGDEPLTARPGVLCASYNTRKGLSQPRR